LKKNIKVASLTAEHEYIRGDTVLSCHGCGASHR